MTGIHIREGEETPAEAQEEHHIKTGREQGNAFISHGAPKIASKPLEAKREAWILLEPSEETNPTNALISDF